MKSFTFSCRVITLFVLAVMMLCGPSAFAQNSVSGTVTDKEGEPLIGVSVREKGATKGVSTDLDGKFVINVAQGKSLEFSYIGYAPKEVKVDGKTLNVVLENSATNLDEVVVIGYGQMTRKDVTSSITTVKAEDLNKGVFTDAASMLQGKVAGLTVTTNGDPNGSPSMTLRGASSLRSGAMSPYYVIDGIPGIDISMVAPDDIESIDVLRDATATAIYGSKAANGVIIVTTKKGKKNDRVNVTYSGYVAFDKALKTLDVASASDIRSYTKSNNIDYAYDGGSDTNWQKEVLRTAISHNHNLSINGGSQRTTYLASLSVNQRQGVVKGSDALRVNLRSLVSTKVLKDHLELSAGVNAMFGKFVGVPMGDEGASVLDAMNYFNPTNPIYDENGGWSKGSGSNNYNPLSLINEDTSENQWKRIQAIGKATVYIIDGLTWNANYSYDNYQRTFSSYHSHNTQIADKNGIVNPSLNGVAERSTYFGNASTFETYGNFDRTFNDVHKVSAMLGFSWEQKTNNDGFGVRVNNFFDDTIKWYNLTYAGEIKGIQGVLSGTKETVRNISFYGRVGYSYASRYMIQATVRRDGSSVFGEGHQWGTFPSVSVAWNMAEEQFMKDQTIVDILKIRLGYGVSGNALGFGAYSARRTYGANGQTFSYQDSTWGILQATKLANPDLKWETTGMFNVGIDFGMFNGRFSGSIEYYIKKTKDLIWDYPVSSYIYPFGTIAANVGEITNKGVEFSFTGIPVQTRDFTWRTTLNFSHNQNRVDRLSNDKYSTSTFAQGDPMVAGVSANGWTQRVMEGQPLGTCYTYEFAGYNEDGLSTYYCRDEETGERNGWVTVSPEYKDRTITGCAQPKLNLGWNNNLTWKNLYVDMFFTGVFGNDIYNGARAHYTAPDFFAGGKNVLKEFITNRFASDTSSNIPSDKFIEKGDYFRMQSLTVGYTFDKFNGWLNTLQVYATCNNVFTITKYSGLDPEVNLGGIDPGVDYRWSNYPHTRTFLLGLKINF